MTRVASTIADVPTTTRSTSSAAPTQPEGKLVNVLCSGVLHAQGGSMRKERIGGANPQRPAWPVRTDTAFVVCAGARECARLYR